MSKPAPDTTHFGFETVTTSEKAGRVRGVFDSVASNNHLMNDLMSGGLHRIWKHYTLERTGLREGDVALDVACGTGDLAAGMSKQVGDAGLVVMTDINAAMLAEGRRRIINRGIVGNDALAQSNAECLPFADDNFNCITIGFGLRNVTEKPAALRSMARVLKPGGRLLILEFSKPSLGALQPLYDLHLFRVLPALGKYIAKDADSYQYLAESIRVHPNQDEMLRLMGEAGLEDSRYYNLSGGIVALHVGYKY
ncbi:MAG: class I SAM-dependent methyltransferase [Gammaproteobacteria bacterium]|nr:class I SAM-dependent methyltransferase [Gammaproteobacteria bacterium]